MYAIVHHYTVNCPTCNSRFATINGLVTDIHLGPEVVQCGSCHAVFKTRWKEWPQLSEDDKLLFLFRGVWLWGVLWLCATVYEYLHSKNIHETVGFALWLFAVFAALVIFTVLFRLVKVLSSVSRYRNPVLPVAAPIAPPVVLTPEMQATFEKALADARWDEAYPRNSKKD